MLHSCHHRLHTDILTKQCCLRWHDYRRLQRACPQAGWSSNYVVRNPMEIIRTYNVDLGMKDTTIILCFFSILYGRNQCIIFNLVIFFIMFPWLCRICNFERKIDGDQMLSILWTFNRKPKHGKDRCIDVNLMAITCDCNPLYGWGFNSDPSQQCTNGMILRNSDQDFSKGNRHSIIMIILWQTFRHNCLMNDDQKVWCRWMIHCVKWWL